jgi:hypothetical protein
MSEVVVIASASTPSPSCENPLKLQRHLLRRLLAIWKKIANVAHKSVCGCQQPFFLQHTAVGNGAMNKFEICLQRRDGSSRN